MSEWLAQWHAHLVLNHALLQGAVPHCNLADGMRWLGLFMLAAWSIRWCLAWFAQRRLFQNARPFPTHTIPGLTGLYTNLGKSLRIRRLPPLLQSPAKHGPAFTSGFFRPGIFLRLPLANQLSKDEMTALLGHELVHVKRNDNLLYAFAELILAATPLWFLQLFAHNLNCDPLAFWGATAACILVMIVGFSKGSRWFREARERSCDDRIVSETGKPLALASALVKTWRWLQGQPVSSQVSNLSQAAGLGVEARIRRLIHYRHSRLRVPKAILTRLLVIAVSSGAAWFLIDYHLAADYNHKLKNCHAQTMITDSGTVLQACQRMQGCPPGDAMPPHLPCLR